MKVLNLRCADGHGFEGWFGSEDDYLDQNGRGLVECPICADRVITRMPSAPRLNLSGGRQPAPVAAAPAAVAEAAAPAATPQSAWLQAMHRVLRETEDVGERFVEEARRIHYGEVPERGIRGLASAQDRQALSDEGIEVAVLPLPAALKGPAH